MELLERSTVRILSAFAEGYWQRILITKRHVLTCAHVVVLEATNTENAHLINTIVQLQFPSLYLSLPTRLKSSL